MSRLIEAALLLTPVAAYLLFRLLVRRGIPNPSRQTLLVFLAAVLLLGAGLVWTSLSERTRGDTRYIPAQLQDGRVIPGHGT